MSPSFRPKKSLGQHFLTNPKIHELIVSAAQIKAGDIVVEIGPGSGLLTDHLLATGARVIAIEKDCEFVVKLREKYKGQDIEIVESDVLSYELQVPSYKLLGNLPYYLTSHLLRKALQTWPPFELAVLMVQKEVAKRMLAKPPDMNMLALLVQCYTEPELVAYVKRGNFRPIPKVDSAIVRLMPNKSFKFQVSSFKILDLAAQGFKHPRKKLANNLPIELLERAGIDPGRRAETLTIQEWQAIAGVV